MSESQTVHKDEQVSFLFEQRLFKLKLEDPLAINNFSSTFKECVSKLPRTFNNDNPEKFCSFFQEWGQFLITSAYGGGSVTLNSEIRVKKEENTMDLIAGTKSILQTKFLSLSGEVSSRSEIAWNNEVAAKFLSTRAIWSGGNKALHENLSASQINPEKWTKWKNSIVAHPEMLFSEFGLYPLHTIMSKVPGNEGKLLLFSISFFFIKFSFALYGYCYRHEYCF